MADVTTGVDLNLSPDELQFVARCISIASCIMADRPLDAIVHTLELHDNKMASCAVTVAEKMYAAVESERASRVY